MSGERQVASWKEFQESGLLWLLNTTVLHPRGYALALVQEEGEVIGWRLMGDGTEAIVFEDDPVLDARFSAVKELLR